MKGALMKLLLVLTLIPVALKYLMGLMAKECEHFPIDFSNINGKTVVITGANSGLGFQTALALAKANATVVLGCRSEQRCSDAKKQILATHPGAHVSYFALDLASLESVKAFAHSVQASHDHLDVLINNAGVMALPTREVTRDGLEMQIGTNHFGHFLLTALLYPSIASSGRIINHSSAAHSLASSSFPEIDLLSESYSPWTAYGNSKLANLLFTFELTRRLRSQGNPKLIDVIAVHPGYSSTNLQADRFPLWEFANSFFAMPAEHGALAQIYAAVDPLASTKTNTYLGPRLVMVGSPAVQATSAASQDVTKQQRLWVESERLTGARFL